VKIRLLSALIALILAIAGAVLIATYVQGANQRALAGTKTQAVLVVAKPIAADTPASGLAPYLEVKQIPVEAMADGAMATLTGITNEVTAVALVPGEQLLRSRLVPPSAVQASGSVKVPAGLQTVTVQLDPAQSVGASIAAGDTVGVFISSSGITKLEIQHVLVTRVQGAPAPAPAATGTTGTTATSGTTATTGTTASAGTDTSSDPVPTADMLVTFAASGDDAEKILYASQFGTIWLSIEPAGAVQPTTGATKTSVIN
jgi:pilus assembly protein CpaB